MSEPRRYCASRWLGDGWYTVEFSARDDADAIAFCNRAGIALDGELCAKIPAVPGAGIVARLWCWLSNRRALRR